MTNKLVLCGLFLLCYIVSDCWTLKEADCEGIFIQIVYEKNLSWWWYLFVFSVCFAVVRKFDESLTAADKKDTKIIEEKFRKYCKTAKGKEARFVSSFTLHLITWNTIHSCIIILQCYYLGGVEESATGILSEMSKPLSWSTPVDKVCEKLKKKDVQICDLRFGM